MNTYEVVEACLFGLCLIMPLLTTAILFAIYRVQRASREASSPLRHRFVTNQFNSSIPCGPGALTRRREVDRCVFSVQTEGEGGYGRNKHKKLTQLLNNIDWK